MESTGEMTRGSENVADTTGGDSKCEMSTAAAAAAESLTTSPADEKPAQTTVLQPAKHNEIPMPSGPKTRYEWYQTETHVTVSILVKNVKKEDLKCDVHESNLSCSIRLPSGSDYSLELDLAHSVVPDQTQIKILGSRVEIKLKKVEGWRWEKLESDGVNDTVKQFYPGQTTATADTVHKYPSSSHYRHNWDAMEAQIKAEEKDEKLEGDAALNKLFQQIYADGSEETRRAMNKSFLESGGTVLSTNWKDIGDKPTECKPPDGMEFKKWDY
jgi:suppressor of G2 allele of SKP1